MQIEQLARSIGVIALACLAGCASTEKTPNVVVHPNSSWDERRQGRAVFSIDDECEGAERWLDSQPDEAFAPTIGQYERFLSSLEIPAWTPGNSDRTRVGSR
jgi:hypothetical protein